jgi:glucose/mannose transport system substrate-binding protein
MIAMSSTILYSISMEKNIIKPLLISILFFFAFAALHHTHSENDGEIEIFHWWLAGREAQAFKQIKQVFQNKNPSLYLSEMTAAGGAGANAIAVLKARLEAGNPPDTFIVPAGREFMETWVCEGDMESLTFIFEQQNLFAAYPADLIDIISHKKDVYSLPVSIRCSNLLWYNKKIFNDNGLTPPRTWEEFFDAAEMLSAKGIIPLALGHSWTQAHLLECVLAGVLGADAYRGLWTGNTAWDGPKVIEALKIFVKILTYVNTYFNDLYWDNAADYVIQGRAAMIIMGDWMGSYLEDRNPDLENEIGLAPAPLTQELFVMHANAFAFPRKAAHKENTVKWLAFCASPACQDTFNPIVGSLPARLDADTSLYGRFQQTIIDYYRNSAILPSVVHRAAACENWSRDFISIVNVLAMTKNTDRAESELKAAAERYIKR